jgi:CubicO group peptidase (beta-lactamase class C family)
MRTAQYQVGLLLLAGCGFGIAGCGSGTTPALPPTPPTKPTYDFSNVHAALKTDASTIGTSTSVLGADFVIVNASGTLFQNHYGLYTGSDVLAIASATKIVSAATIMTLVDQQKLSLDVPISTYLSYWTDPAKASITMRMLLSHTSGLPGLNQQEACIGDQSADMTLDECAQIIAKDKLIAVPGTAFAYSGEDFQVAGAVIQAITHTDWDTYFEQAIAQPCDLTTFNYDHDAPNPRIAGGGYTNTADYAILLRMLLSGGLCGSTRVLSTIAVAEMEEDELTAKESILYTPGLSIPPYSYGLGFWLDPPSNNGGTTTTEYSDPGAFGATPWIDTKNGYAAFLLIENTDVKGVTIQSQLTPLILQDLANAH